MQILNSIKALQSQLALWKTVGERIALVPTMGNLHAGHLALVKAAKAAADRVVVSIFVNPTQFGPNEDFASYPRTVFEDQQQLQAEHADALFLPSSDILYPPGAKTLVVVDQLSKIHCGASRPGHFNGVATIVTKLFNIVQPESAFFGEKDWQQLAIIRQLTNDLNIAVAINSVATVRDDDGLAMSSRNSFLLPTERLIAAQLYQTLCSAKNDVLADQSAFKSIEQNALRHLEQAGFEPDYFVICDQHSLQPAQKGDKELVILAAAKLGKPRLIDNISFSIS